MTQKIRIVRSDKRTYEQYVAQGLWKPTSEVKWYANYAGQVEVDAKVKRMRGDTEPVFVKATIIIQGYFPIPKTTR